MPILAGILALTFIGRAPQGTVEVPFHIGEDSIIVDATINSRPVTCLFDTGFGGAMVVNDTIDIGPATGTMLLRDFVGEMQAKTVKIKSLKLGEKSIESSGMEAVVQGLGPMGMAYGIHCDGIMGLETIMHNVVQINFKDKKFVFFPKSVDISTRVPDNKTTFMAKMLPLGSNSIQLEVLTNAGKKMTLALDTGNAFYATTHKDVLERVGLWTGGKDAVYTHYSGVASGTVVSWDYMMTDATIFGVPVKSSVWDVIDRPSSSAENDGTVGFGFLRNFNITFDYERRRVWLEKISDNVGNQVEGDLGISARTDPIANAVKVYLISPGSPAAAAGIKEDDAILSIDGDDLIGAIGFHRLRKMLAGPVGSKVKLAISHQGNLRRVELTRAEMVNK